MMLERLVVRLAALALLAGPLAAQNAKSSPAGGFQVGDQISLQVEGDTLFSKTFSVGQGPALMLPGIGAISLTGVQRAEVETYLTQQLGRYLKNPTVHAKALVRLSILGEVEHPGFYAVPADVVIGDALMVAGGPTRDAKIGDWRIERNGDRVWAGDPLRKAIAQSMTVDQMNLHTGDQIVVPREVRKDAETTWRIIGILVTLPVAIYGLTRLGH
jgi:protein involved in polysaccharide export with SLBB domain